MTEKDPTLRRQSLIAGVIAIGSGLIVGLIVGVAIAEMVACPDPKCVTGHVQHLLAFLGTVTAALASGVQGKTAKTKSDYHRDSADGEVGGEVIVSHGRCRRRVAYPRRSQP